MTSYLDSVQARLQKAERERAVAEAREHEERKRRKVQLALVASVLAMMVGLGAFAFRRNEEAQLVRQREARNAEAVTGLLAQAEESLRAGDAAKAAVALEAAEKRSTEGGAEKEAERIGRLDADLTVLRELDAVDQFRWTWKDNKQPDLPAVATRVREAVRRFGADPDVVSGDDAVARASASVVRERIVAALDGLLQQEKSTAVRALLGRVDADPYRDAARDMMLTGDAAKMRELVGQQAALEQPPGFVAFLSKSKAIPVERRRQLLLAAVTRHPADLSMLMALGDTYEVGEKETVDERLRWYQAAVAAAPANAAAHNNLGIALSDKGQLDEAIACLKRAIELDPKLAIAHANLGHAMSDKGQLEDAIACYKKAIELVPEFAAAHNSLGAILCNMNRDHDAAVVCFRKAIELDPKYAEPHYNLGNALTAKGQVDEAIASYEKAIDLDPSIAEVRCNLGHALATQGRFAESLEALKRGHELGSKQPGWRYPSADWVRQAEAKAAMEAKLPAFFKGEFHPNDTKERLGLAGVCLVKKLHRTAAELYAAAFAADPKLADDFEAGHRYSAACFAALAAVGQGDDAANLDDNEKTRFRKQGLAWLRADLVLRTKQFNSANPADRAAAEQVVRHWQQDTDLAGIRDAAALAKLPVDEQKACTQLWAEVAALLKKAEGKPK